MPKLSFIFGTRSCVFNHLTALNVKKRILFFALFPPPRASQPHPARRDWVRSAWGVCAKAALCPAEPGAQRARAISEFPTGSHHLQFLASSDKFSAPWNSIKKRAYCSSLHDVLKNVKRVAASFSFKDRQTHGTVIVPLPAFVRGD